MPRKRLNGTIDGAGITKPRKDRSPESVKYAYLKARLAKGLPTLDSNKAWFAAETERRKAVSQGTPQVAAPIPPQTAPRQVSAGGPAPEIPPPIQAPLPPNLPPEPPPININFSPPEESHVDSEATSGSSLGHTELGRDSPAGEPSVSAPSGPDERKQFSAWVAKLGWQAVQQLGNYAASEGMFNLNAILELAQYEKCLETVIYESAPADMDPTKVAKYVVVGGAFGNGLGAGLAWRAKSKKKQPGNSVQRASEPGEVRQPGEPANSNGQRHEQSPADMGLHGPGEEEAWQAVMGQPNFAA